MAKMTRRMTSKLPTPAIRRRLQQLLAQRRALNVSFTTPKPLSVTLFGPPASQAWRRRVMEILQREKTPFHPFARKCPPGFVLYAPGTRSEKCVPAGKVPPSVKPKRRPAPTAPVSPPQEVTPSGPELEVGERNFGPSVPAEARAAQQMIEVSPIERGGQALDQDTFRYDDFHGQQYGFSESEGDFGDIEQDLGLAD